MVDREIGELVNWCLGGERQSGEIGALIRVTIRYYNVLRRQAGLASEALELPDGADLATAVGRLAERHGPAMAALLLAPSGELAPHLVVFVNGQLVHPGRSGPPLADGDELRLFSAVSGGQREAPMQPPATDGIVLVLGQWLWADTTRPPRPDHGLAIADGRVLAAGPHAELVARFPAAAVVDANDCVVTPAFVNAHHHMYGVLAHGIPLEEAPAGFWPFLEDFWWPRVEDRLDHELIAAATDWACLEMVRSGVTAFYDCLEAPNALPGALAVEAEVVRRWGLRGVLSFEATERVSAANGELGLRENADFVDDCRALGGPVSGLICFHTTFTCSEPFIRRAFALAAGRGVKVHMHLSEGTYEPAYCLAHFGQRPVAYYDRLGLLGPQVLASQCVQVDADEIATLARRGVHVSHQPLSNCEVGGGFSPVPEMLAAGVNVALGTDGYVNNFFEVMRAAALIPKARLLDPTTMPAAAVWTMATQNGARALGLNDLGTLVPGSQADLLLIAADLPTPLAAHNLADQSLLWRNPEHLRGVMAAGRWLLWGGQVVGQDPAAIRARVVAAAGRLWGW